MKHFWIACGWAFILASMAAAQAPTVSGPAANLLMVPSDIAFLAALSTPIVINQVKSGDAVEAQTSQDIKQGREVLLKKGAILIGHVDSVQPPTTNNSERGVVLVFDRVKPKKGEEMQFNLVIQALAPKSDVQTDSVPFATGRGMQGATLDNLPPGHASATQGTVNPLTIKSKGVQDLRGLELRELITDGKHYTVLAASRNDIQLKKGTQLVMRVVRP